MRSRFLEHLLDSGIYWIKYSLGYFFNLFVLRPNKRYIGQKLTKLVAINIPDNTRRTIATAPLNSVVVQYKTMTIIAVNTLKIRSAVPMFLFITSKLI